MGFSKPPLKNDPQNIVALFQKIAEREKQVTDILHEVPIKSLQYIINYI